MESRLCFSFFVSVTEAPCCVRELPNELTTNSAVSLLQPTGESDARSLRQTPTAFPITCLLHCLLVCLSPCLSVLPDVSGTPEPSSLLPSLSLLLFFVPVVAVTAGVLLWRRGPCTLSQSESCHLSFFFLDYWQLTLTG